jgi:quercetin dioxygenase-like cupin family protein
VQFRPKKNQLNLGLKLPQSDSLDAKIEEAGLETLEYKKRWGQYQLRLTREDIRTKGDALRDVIKIATGRSAKTLAKYADFRIVQVSMKAKTRMGQHQAEGRISIQCLAGRRRIHLPAKPKAEMTAGDLLILDCGITHDVEAVEESAFLLTICWSPLHA